MFIAGLARMENYAPFTLHDRISRGQTLLDEYARLARAAHASMAQLALAWVLARGEHVVAIPGTTREAHLEENLGAAAVELQPDLIARLDALINQRTVAGERYNAATQAEVDTEKF